ncbi:hypothetical protein ABID52_001777 [Fictibacillus halophilus]|uniref:HTH-like domain-containing protein n=1 Tax=Fictibacillus halophilus TaxID=1610490 RepID=A0ABV2LI06_9BACL|nr:hypothetical protein [Fictibacillus halophilus]
MNINELGLILKNMYDKAPQGYQVASIHLFGIEYAEIIQRNHYSIKEILASSGLNSSYSTEISKGIKLS